MYFPLSTWILLYVHVSENKQFQLLMGCFLDKTKREQEPKWGGIPAFYIKSHVMSYAAIVLCNKRNKGCIEMGLLQWYYSKFVYTGLQLNVTVKKINVHLH